MPKEITPDNEAPSNITDHPFTAPEGQPWATCAYPGCGLAESVHQASVTPFVPSATIYRCPDCITTNKQSCNHPREGEQVL